MEQQDYSDPAHNLRCDYRFTCGTLKCPDVKVFSEMPICHVDKFKRYQPETDSRWYDRNWKEVNRITWREVFCLRESWIYTLLLIIILVFAFMVMVLVKLLFRI
ncbi:MAG: hypothetical protein J5U17_04620 [Candidatus Methanoperedens sp.]|nr:hypothetical protein [Candidatus Methanoperedens sp.]MCE8425041.1 hypothetical protein [Candidatus Methanoperedens sp.]MCE8426793.1 hypothetical protein [Candidatus Methanoperedens sp.]